MFWQQVQAPYLIKIVLLFFFLFTVRLPFITFIVLNHPTQEVLQRRQHITVLIEPNHYSHRTLHVTQTDKTTLVLMMNQTKLFTKVCYLSIISCNPISLLRDLRKQFSHLQCWSSLNRSTKCLLYCKLQQQFHCYMTYENRSLYPVWSLVLAFRQSKTTDQRTEWIKLYHDFHWYAIYKNRGLSRNFETSSGALIMFARPEGPSSGKGVWHGKGGDAKFQWFGQYFVPSDDSGKSFLINS